MNPFHMPATGELDGRYGEVSRCLAEFAADLRFEEIRLEAVEAVRRSIIDQLGIQLLLTSRTTGRKSAEYARSAGPGPSTVVGHGFRAVPEYAAFANGVAGHSLELDDGHLPSLNHPGCVTVPPALAVAESRRTPGSRFLLAVIAGAEVMGRVGSGLGIQYVYGRGFHPVGVIGPLGAAVGAAKLTDATPRIMLNALGLAVSQGAGTLEYNQTWGETTRLHAGFASMAGIRSAALASLGIPGPGAPIEGKYGLAHVHSDHVNFSKMTAGLGSNWTVEDTWFKTRPFHGIVHNCIDVCLSTLARHGRTIDESGIDQVDRIGFGLSSAGVRGILEGSAPDRFGESLTALNFSLPIAVAHAILHGGSLDSVLTFENPSEHENRLANKITGAFDQRSEDEWRRQRLLATVEIAWSDGHVVRGVGRLHGSLEDPLTTPELEEKFLALAGRAVGDEKARAILALLNQLEELGDLELLGQLLATPARP